MLEDSEEEEEDVPGSVEVWSIHMLPGLSADNAPVGPSIAARTCGGAGNAVNKTVTERASAAGESLHRAPKVSSGSAACLNLLP